MGMTADDLRAHRLALGYSVSLMSEVIGIRPEVLADWESGRRPIEEPDWLAAALRAIVHTHESASPVCGLVMLDGEV